MQTPSSLQSAKAALPRLSQAAAARVALLRDAEGKPNLMFRLKVLGGGCSGFQYQFDFAETVAPDDRRIETDGVVMLVDEASLPFLEGAEEDYVEELIGASFRVTNPQATASCGCGTSFSVF